MRSTEDATHSRGTEAGVIHLGNLVIDLEGFRVWIDQDEVPLTRMEFDLLIELAVQADRVVSLQILGTRLWGTFGQKERHRLTVLVFRLREKLQGSSPYQIRTRRGRGYGLLTSTRDPP